MKKANMPAFFCIGALGYPCLELLWRKRTHPSMALAGGMSLCALKKIQSTFTQKPLWLRCAIGAGAITGIELLTGLIFNRHYQVWDYRKCKCQFKGHICAQYTGIWFLLCGALFPLIKKLPFKP